MTQGRCRTVLSLTVILFVLISILILAPWLARYRADQQEIQAQLSQLARWQAIESRQPLFEQQLEQVRIAVQQAPYYLRAETIALAGAELQGLVKRVVERHEGKLESTQILPTQPNDQQTAPRITVRVRMKGTIEVLLEVLHALEGNQPLLFVDNLSIRANRAVTSRRTTNRRRRARPTSSPDELDINYDLSGYLRERAE